MRPFLVVVLMILFAGCATSADPAATVSDGDGATVGARDPVTTSFPIALAVALPSNEPADSQQGSFDVLEGADQTLVEARWTCSSPTCKFYVWVNSDPDAGDAADETSDPGVNEASLTVKLDPGSYFARTRSAQPAANMEGEIRITVFFGPIPEGFSAFEV